jgi:hypothetical protein
MITPDRAEKVVLAACTLHNMLRIRCPNAWQGLLDVEDEQTHLLNPGTWRLGPQMHNVAPLRGNTAMKDAKEQRDKIADYFLSPVGAVSWQEFRH